MEDSIYGEEIEKLDLPKYGLSHLRGRNLLTLDDGDLEKLLNALGDDDISLNLPLTCTQQHVEEVLSYGECRRCGRCCRPNPLNPASPGVEVFEEELKSMAEFVHSPYEVMRSKTSQGNATPYAYQVVKLGLTRWMSLPCPFFADEGGCQAYPVRAVVCKTYPIIFTGDDTQMSIRATCEYGREIIGCVCKRLRAADPQLIVEL